MVKEQKDQASKKMLKYDLFVQGCCLKNGKRKFSQKWAITPRRVWCVILDGQNCNKWFIIDKISNADVTGIM